jgi:hypothetical protein
LQNAQSTNGLLMLAVRLLLLLLLQELPLLDAGYYGAQLEGQLYDLSNYNDKNFQVRHHCCCCCCCMFLLKRVVCCSVCDCLFHQQVFTLLVTCLYHFSLLPASR